MKKIEDKFVKFKEKRQVIKAEKKEKKEIKKAEKEEKKAEDMFLKNFSDIDNIQYRASTNVQTVKKSADGTIIGSHGQTKSGILTGLKKDLQETREEKKEGKYKFGDFTKKQV